MNHLIAKKAPDFSARAVMADNRIESEFKLSEFKDKYIVLFFYPLDFSYVCPTEILAFDEKLNEFKKRDAEVIGISVDSVFSHLAWKKSPVEKGGIGTVRYPLVSDMERNIANAYGVMLDQAVAVRALFLIDRKGIVRHTSLYDDALGRSVNETLRVLDALRHHDEYGKMCPANWEQGNDSLNASHAGVVDYLSKFAKTS